MRTRRDREVSLEGIDPAAPPVTLHPPQPQTDRSQVRTGAVLVWVLALVLFGAAIWRSTLGVSLTDDSYNAIMALRLGTGAIPFADEMTTQSLGFLLAAPFAAVWHLLFGTSGIVLALRILYVVVAAIVGFGCVRLLAPSFGTAASVVGVGVVLLCPPFSVFGLTYNTSAELAFLFALVLSFVAIRDNDPRAAAAAGFAAGVGVVSYPPLVVAAAVLWLVLAGLSRDRTVTVAALGAGLLTVGVAALAILIAAGPDDIRATLEIAAARWPWESARDKIGFLLTQARVSFTRGALLPMWVLALIAALPWPRRTVNAIAAGALPLAAAVPGFLRLQEGADPRYFGVMPSAFLLTLTAGAVIPVLAYAYRSDDEGLRRLIGLAAGFSLVAIPTIAYATTAGWYWAVPIVGAAPLCAAVLVGWGVLLQSEGGGVTLTIAAGLLVVIVIGLLFSTSFKDAAPSELSRRIAGGPFAGIATTPERAGEFATFEGSAELQIADDDSVMVLGSPGLYLLAGGTSYTNTVWWPGPPGPESSHTVRYFEEHDGPPDVVYVSRGMLEDAGGIEQAAEADPFFEILASDYRVVDTVPGYLVMRRR